MVLALIGDIGLVEVRAGLAPRRLEAYLMILVDVVGDCRAGSFCRGLKLRLRPPMVVDHLAREGLHLLCRVAGPVEGLAATPQLRRDCCSRPWSGIARSALEFRCPCGTRRQDETDDNGILQFHALVSRAMCRAHV